MADITTKVFCPKPGVNFQFERELFSETISFNVQLSESFTDINYINEINIDEDSKSFNKNYLGSDNPSVLTIIKESGTFINATIRVIVNGIIIRDDVDITIEMNEGIYIVKGIDAKSEISVKIFNGL